MRLVYIMHLMRSCRRTRHRARAPRTIGPVRGGVVLFSMLVILTAGCKDPTEITFALSTDVPCDRITGIAITVGAPGDVETKAVATTSHRCVGAGDLGSI